MSPTDLSVYLSKHLPPNYTGKMTLDDVCNPVSSHIKVLSLRLWERGVGWQSAIGTPKLAQCNLMGAVVWISAWHFLLLLWTGRVGGNYRHSASHLPEELRLQNGPALFILDWAGATQSAEGTGCPRFNAPTHTHAEAHLPCTQSAMCMYPPYRDKWWLWSQLQPTLPKNCKKTRSVYKTLITHR